MNNVEVRVTIFKDQQFRNKTKKRLYQIYRALRLAHVNSIDIKSLACQKGSENIKFIKSEKELLEEFGTPCLVC